MEEREVEYVRMMDAGRVRLGYDNPMESDAFQSMRGSKFQALAHGNRHGLTVVPTKEGFAVLTEDEAALANRAYVQRRLEAIDHGQNTMHVKAEELKVRREVVLPAIAYAVALSVDERQLAVAYGDAVALYEVAAVLQEATPRPYRVFEGVAAEEMVWGGEEETPCLAVITETKTAIECSTEGSKRRVRGEGTSSAVCWSPDGTQLAVGTTEGTVEIFKRGSEAVERTIARPECCEEDGYEGMMRIYRKQMQIW